MRTVSGVITRFVKHLVLINSQLTIHGHMKRQRSTIAKSTQKKCLDNEFG